MKVIGIAPFKLEEDNQFEAFDVDIPMPSGHELLVKIQSISVNPVDTKQRLMSVDEAPRILGFDEVGIVLKKLVTKYPCFNQEIKSFIRVLLTKMDPMKNINL